MCYVCCAEICEVKKKKITVPHDSKVWHDLDRLNISQQINFMNWEVWVFFINLYGKITTKGWIEIFYETCIPILWKFYLFMIDVHIEKLYWYI